MKIPGMLHYCQIYNITQYQPEYTAYFSKHMWHQESLLQCEPAGNPYYFLQKTPYNPPPAMESDEMPPTRSNDRGERELWMLWAVRKYFAKYIKKYQMEECGDDGRLAYQ